MINHIMMSQLSSKSLNQGEEEILLQRKNNKSDWVEGFVKRTFFDSCPTHPIRRNETNIYCINCNLTACQYCISSGNHRHHKVLQIYRHVYRDVVSLGTLEKYVDCSYIQPYKCNKRLVISLTPLPHCGPLLNDGVCEVCKRRLVEPELYNFCSLSCKVKAFARKPVDAITTFLSLHPSTNVRRKKEKEPSKRRQKRKGEPCRAPFF